VVSLRILVAIVAKLVGRVTAVIHMAKAVPRQPSSVDVPIGQDIKNVGCPTKKPMFYGWRVAGIWGIVL